ncbi:DEAD/DEAH box helicase [Candidatus Sumerlaeota bacterium]|nr:DEAD/DEAH box helicase [Candidatus Sumerlaeota bacterium]
MEQAPIDALVAELYEHPGFKHSIAHKHVTPAVEARYGEWPATIPEKLIAAMHARGLARPYLHQQQAIDLALQGRNPVIITPTASGKSLCYNVPVVESIIKNPEARAIYLFPTKALSHDQYGELYELTKACDSDIKVFTYDGDTPPATRRALKDAGHIIVSNPDMMHAGILPHHTSWVRLFENLKYVVIDELHQYRGVFGSHMANVLRRLRRICAFYGSKPTFICSSATIKNAKELAESLIGEPVHLVDESGAPRGARTFLFFNPPVINSELNVRRSVRLEMRRLAMRFLARNHQVIVFGRSRLDVEVMTTYLKRGMARIHRDPALIAGYRSGYLPTERREIEQGLKKKEILGVVSTNALELGIDIGSLDVAILAGWPGTIASAWQQSGRAGRKAGGSLTIYIAGSSPLDQFLVNHPEYFFGNSPEEAIINPENLSILSSHLKCAAFELPFEDSETFGPTSPAPILQYLEDERVLRHSGTRWHYSSDAYPSEDISLRSAAGENFIVLDSGNNNKVIAEVDFDSAPFLIHDDAVYIHNAKTYLVEKLDWDRRTAFVRHRVLDYYTDSESSSTVQVMNIDEERHLPENSLLEAIRFGPVSVTTIVAKFKKVKFESQESIGYGPVSVPPLEVQTEAMWFSLRDNRRKDHAHHDFAPSLQGVANLLRHTVPLHVLCDKSDFGVYAMVRAPFDQRPTIYIWDRYPGGIGIARKLYAITDRILSSAARIAEECSCAAGCPACIGPQLDRGREAKQGARTLLRLLQA